MAVCNSSYCVKALYWPSRAKFRYRGVGSVSFLDALGPGLDQRLGGFFQSAVARASVCRLRDCSAFTLSRPASSNLPHGSPTRPAASVLQLSSIAFFCRSDIWLCCPCSSRRRTS